MKEKPITQWGRGQGSGSESPESGAHLWGQKVRDSGNQRLTKYSEKTAILELNNQSVAF